MNAVTSHLDDLLTVLRVSGDFRARAEPVEHLPRQLIQRLELVRPDLAARVKALDEWHAEVLADFIADAQFVAVALDYTATGGAEDDTRVG